MRHVLMHPAYPDIIGDWARTVAEANEGHCANDNCGADYVGELSDPLIDFIARLEVERTRLW
jgi:hypothetical protein